MHPLMSSGPWSAPGVERSAGPEATGVPPSRLLHLLPSRGPAGCPLSSGHIPVRLGGFGEVPCLFSVWSGAGLCALYPRCRLGLGSPMAQGRMCLLTLGVLTLWKVQPQLVPIRLLPL